MFKSGDRVVITTIKPYHPFAIGNRGEITEVVGICYLIESNYQEAIVKEEDIRDYDACDEYDDMYCDKCGGTACLC